MKRLKLTIEYDGSRLNGWQIQPKDLSVQQVLQDACAAVFGQAIEVVGAGRTDSGVHALGQVAHVDLPPLFTPNQPPNLYRLRASLNHFVNPHGVSVRNIEPVADDFHARFSAIRRRYCYRIHTHPAISPLHRGRVWHFGQSLDLLAMQQAAKLLEGQQDFSSFRDAKCQAKTPMRSMERVEVVAANSDLQAGEVQFRVTARSFLHHQVRIMVGSLVKIGLHRHPPEWLGGVLAARDRDQAGPTAPPEGLYLVGVDYPA